MKFNDESLNAMAAVSFLIGMANYEENLTQNDKDDIMQKFDEQTKDVLGKINKELQHQNKLLDEQTLLLKKIMEKVNGKAES